MLETLANYCVLFGFVTAMLFVAWRFVRFLYTRVTGGRE